MPESPIPTQRYPAVDALRGTAIALMFAYHFSYDLDYFGLARFDFAGDPFWLGFRALILSLFLGTVGISLQLATAGGVRPRPFLRRLGQLALAAVGISVVSQIMFPGRVIFFGILHFIAFASVLGLLFRSFDRANLVLGLALVALGLGFQHPLFDTPALQWIGLMTHKPTTEDYVPLLPWFGVVLIGMFLGRRVFNERGPAALRGWRGNGPLARLLALGGRHSLAIYLLHQPLFMGLLWTVLSLAGDA